jgi:hypothetical protein
MNLLNGCNWLRVGSSVWLGIKDVVEPSVSTSRVN